MDRKHAGSVALLACGVVLVFAGLSSALGFSLAGMMASIAAIAALLYAGGVWFGEASRADRSMVLFTRALSIAEGPLRGRPIADLFPDGMRGEIDARCQAALAGSASHFSCASATGPVSFSATPVRDDAGAVVYGLLLSGALLATDAHTPQTNTGHKPTQTNSGHRPTQTNTDQDSPQTSTDPNRAGLSVT